MRYADNLPFDLADVGQWWGTDPREKKQIQIDIVGVPVQESNQKIAEYLMGSCKFKNEKIGLNELELLERYAMAFAKGEKYYYIIFSLGGFTEEDVSGSCLFAYCNHVLEQLNKGNTKELSKAEDEEFLKCLKALADLKEPEWKRVFSSKVFEKKNDITPSKVFERIYQGVVIEALKYSPQYEEGMSDDEILAAHGILSYSQTLEWKGAVEYCMTDRNGTAIEKKIDTSLNYYGTVLNAQTLEHAVPSLRNSVEKIIVIENKANYESMEYDPKVLYIFCHGYFSPKEVRFLQMLMKTAPEEIQCYHWGDMDYGGIQIFLYNEKNIFPNLIPWKMDVPSYKAALEKEKGIKLCSKKQKKLEALNAGKLEVLKQCILENKMEIEQEMLI